jgi:UDP-N-acetylmuramyl pentapeptide phosphotransferase/UDP-N-acetylglucosamine-1-phosphate transferase
MEAVAWTAWFAASVGAATWLTFRLIDWASALGVVDRPNERSSHTRVTPRGGGLSIVLVTAAAAVVAAVLHPAAAGNLAAVTVPAVVIAFVSWRDDVSSLPNRVRFGVHLGAAAATVAALGPLASVDLGRYGTFELGPLAWPVTLLWIVGMTNAFNFMDGIDGIAGITAAVAGAAVAAAGFLLGATPVAAVALAFAASSLGFLSCNWPPARIFMGDVGSAFCGFVIAVLPLAFPGEFVPRIVPLVALAMWPFIFDTAFTLLRRLRRGENVFQAHRSHLYQRLVIAGWSHKAASSLYGCLSSMAAAVGLCGLVNPDLRATSDAVALATVVVGAALLLTLVHVAERGPGAEATGIGA